MQTQHPPFKFQLGQRLALTVSGENGECISRSEHTTAEPQYLIRYRMADGRATEQWWSQSAIEPCDGVLASAMASIVPSPTGTLTPVATPTTLPRIGAWIEAAGGNYAGIARGLDGGPDYHLVLCTDRPAPAQLNWPDAMAWAQGLGCSLPNRAETALLFAHLRSEVGTTGFVWTSESYDSSYAWGQDFLIGYQDLNSKSVEAHARAVRRFPLQSFDPSATLAAGHALTEDALAAA